jgi:prepilin-type N-terminal cleavage/methylation domain-containing protein
MRRFCSKSSKGYTLTEVLVASVLLLVVSVPILKALTANYVFSNSIKYKTQSTILAKSRMDRARAIAANLYNTSLTENNTSLGGGYLCSTSDTGYSGDLRTVSISAGFDKDNDGTLDTDETQITLSTLIARR